MPISWLKWSAASALLVGGWAIGQLWLFWIAPIAGAILGGLGYHGLGSDEPPVFRASAASQA